MKLGVLGAMPEEIDLVKENMSGLTCTRKARMDIYEGTIGTTQVALAACAAGKVNAALATQILVDHFSVTHVVFTGVAGSLDARLDIGDIVVSTDCVNHDFDATGLGHAIGYNYDIDMTYFDADPVLRAAALSAAHATCPDIAILEGRVATGDQFISDPAVKQRIIENFGAICCEMEGVGVAQAAWLNDVPYVVLRAISDKADDDGRVDFRSFLTSSAKRCADIVVHLALHAEELL